jgi:beta-galactosidase GanA
MLLVVPSWGMTSAAENPAIPRIERVGNQYHLLVDGRPFLMLGGQAHNSSASNPKDLKPVWASLNALNANTAEVPLYWELMEPTPGKFDYQLMDAAIEGARQHGLRLVFLWFGTWKNGGMDYTPAWVKENPQKYFRVINDVGQPMDILSPFCRACREADADAFAHVMTHLRSVDANHRTVIMVQVENETGLLGTDRDYSPQATRRFDGPVPAPLMSYLETHRSTLARGLSAAWARAGRRDSGTWTQVFGNMAAEAFSAWYVARYVNAVAAAGKRAYPLPMYVNDWLINPGNARPGDWPSGGPTRHVLDIWKAAAPRIDLIAPDIYLPEFQRTSAEYTRPDNPLFVPEIRFSPAYAAYAYLALGQFNAIGFSPFGIDHALENGKLTSRAAPLADTYRLLRPMLPLIERFQYSGKLFPIVQNADWAQAIRLTPRLAAVVTFPQPYSLDGPWGRGIIVELAPDDYIVAGTGLHVSFRELTGPPRKPEFLSIDQGTFRSGHWVFRRRLNGDEEHVSLPPQRGRILRVRLVP